LSIFFLKKFLKDSIQEELSLSLSSVIYFEIKKNPFKGIPKKYSNLRFKRKEKKTKGKTKTKKKAFSKQTGTFAKI